jgi:DNA-binding NarL/FixJ family response regulator
MKRLLIIAAGPLEAEALRRGLRYAPDCQVIGFADIHRPCGWTVRDAEAEVILIDDCGASNVTMARLHEARQSAPDATIVCRTASVDSSWPREAVEAGADAAIDAGVDAARMGLLVREIVAGTVFRALPRGTARPAALPPAVAGLTARELQILCLTAAGATNSAIAAELWVTEQTVKFHLSNLYRKLGVANRTEASHYAHVNGLLNTAPAEVVTGDTKVGAAA